MKDLWSWMTALRQLNLQVLFWIQNQRWMWWACVTGEFICSPHAWATLILKKKLSSGDIYIYIIYYISLFGRNQVLFASICYHFTQFVSFENNNSTRASIHKRTVSARSGLRLRCNKLFSSMPGKLRQTGANASSTVSPTSFQGIF